MSPWIPIAVSAVTTVVVGLVGFIVKRELGRVAQDLTAIRAALKVEVAAREKAFDNLTAELKNFDSKFLSREMFDQMEASRKEIEALRRESDTRLEHLINQLLSKYGGGSGKNADR